MELEIMHCVLRKRTLWHPPHGTIYLDLWDAETTTNAELNLTFPENVIEATYNYFDNLQRKRSKVDPIKIMIFHSLINKEKNSFAEALEKVGNIDLL